MAIQLPFLLLKSFRQRCTAVPTSLQALQPHCARLVLEGWQVRGDLYEEMRSQGRAFPSLPFREQRFFDRASPRDAVRVQSVLDVTLVDIARLVLECRDGWEPVRRRLMWSRTGRCRRPLPTFLPKWRLCALAGARHCSTRRNGSPSATSSTCSAGSIRMAVRTRGTTST
ncbi:uncharacterized protein LOC129591009 [Paramacrobiotus metropolitanus]|uniref:uncharacterized protein LOC129591009 n=1 Tax=Paramacrobiotus metropolitanus TaxID=2943436 RepID=UPI002446286B|nr:uncharacterized protein LOC129591009 [Paramacrobiotus metropolitanus]